MKNLYLFIYFCLLSFLWDVFYNFHYTGHSHLFYVFHIFMLLKMIFIILMFYCLMSLCGNTFDIIWGEIQKNRQLFIKHCVFILICLNFSHLKSALHLKQYTYWHIFSTAQKFWTCWIWCFLLLLPLVVLPLPNQ